MKHLAKVPLVMLALVLTFSVAPRIAFAHEGEEQTEQETTTLSDLLQKRKEAAEKRAADAKLARETENGRTGSLDEKFKKACENRQANYQNRLENISKRSQRHLDVLDKIVDRVKAFKEDKAVTVENYDALLADIAAKKAVVHDLQDLIGEKAKEDFSCERGAAKESVQAFKDLLHQQIDALKDYKTAVKNLIVAVKTAVGATKTEQGDSNESQE
jgi:hypothetical protein